MTLKRRSRRQQLLVASNDGICDLSWIFMLPEAQYAPSTCSEGDISLGVSRLVAGDLGSPERRVGFWELEVPRTSMPVATVDENGQMDTSERDVRSTSAIDNQRYIDAVAQAARVE
jgi:hypothetical protein